MPYEPEQIREYMDLCVMLGQLDDPSKNLALYSHLISLPGVEEELTRFKADMSRKRATIQRTRSLAESVPQELRTDMFEESIAGLDRLLAFIDSE